MSENLGNASRGDAAADFRQGRAHDRGIATSRGDICAKADAAVRASFEKVALYQKIIYINNLFLRYLKERNSEII